MDIYADDTTVMASAHFSDIQSLTRRLDSDLDAVNEWASNNRMFINKAKTKSLLVPQENVCGSRDGAVVRALASHQCGSGSIPGLSVICGLSLLLVLVPAPRVFLRVLRFSSLHKNQHY